MINHIYCGDCQEILPLLQKESVDAVVTDPPYGMEFRSNHRRVKYKKISNDKKEDVSTWLGQVVWELHRVMKPNTALYWFCNMHSVSEFVFEIEKLFKIKNILIWEKNNTGMGDLSAAYAPKYEMIIYANKGRRELIGRRDPDILHFNRTGNIHHPTEKPVDLLEYLLSKSTNEGDIVLDPFLGSGSTAVACKNTNRNYVGIEMEPDYYKKALERIKENA